jgi:hypothetical protein
MKKSMTLQQALYNAEILVDEPSGSEYERGILDLLAFSFGEDGVTTTERMVDLAKELGWPYKHLVSSSSGLTSL